MIQQIGIVYLLFVNILTFSVFGADKRRAREKRWRIPEKQLLMLCAAGGSVGALVGMQVFHYKTRKWKFRLGVPAILAAQAVLVYWMNVTGR